METLERSRVCRLCGKKAGLTIKIFDKRGNHAKKINSVLPIVVHEMDLLPKHMCHSCNFKLQEFHKFYEDCLKTDDDLKSQLSWMHGSDNREKIILPMVQISNVQIKSEPPDYDEQESAQVFFNNGGFTNFVKNTRMPLPEKIFESNGGVCSRCGCYCGNRIRGNDDSRNCSKTRINRHNGAKQSDQDFTAKDTIRRNLFATEIFGDKNPQIQTEIPICNIPRDVLTDAIETDEVRSDARLRRLACRQNGVRARTNNKMILDAKKMAERTPRPGSHASNSVSAAVGIIERSKYKSTQDVTKNDSNVAATPRVKLEPFEDCVRSLRPRMEAIDYSESKRKNPMARANVLPRRIGCRQGGRKVSNNSTKYKQDITTDSAIMVKVENERESSDITSIHKTRNNLKTQILTRQRVKKLSEMTSGKFLNDASGDDAPSRKCLVGPKSRAHRSNNGTANASKRKNVETNYCHTSFYLRSQRGHLRSGKLKEIDSFVQKPKKNQYRNMLRGLSADSTKGKRSEGNNESSAGMTFVYRYCDTCKARFASSELYMLHGCYTNQRH